MAGETPEEFRSPRFGRFARTRGGRPADHAFERGESIERAAGRRRRGIVDISSPRLCLEGRIKRHISINDPILPGARFGKWVPRTRNRKIDYARKMCHIEHMITISIRELHNKTGKWIRSASQDQKIIVTERGQPIATIGPFSSNEMGTPFSKRREISAFKKLPKVHSDSSRLISDDRNRS